MTGGARCCFGFLVLIAQILLHGVLGLVWFWIVHYHSDEKATWGAFAWRDNPELEFNLHPVLMITGFIYFSGQCMYKCSEIFWKYFSNFLAVYFVKPIYYLFWVNFGILLVERLNKTNMQNTLQKKELYAWWNDLSKSSQNLTK